MCVALCCVKNKDGCVGENTEQVPHLPSRVRLLPAKTTVKQWRRKEASVPFDAAWRRHPTPVSSSLHHHSHPLSLSVSLHPFAGGLELPGSATRITRSISQTLSFPRVFSVVYPSISLSSLSLSLTHSLTLLLPVVNLCFHPLPFTFPRRFGPRAEGGTLDEQKDMKRKRRGRGGMRDSPPFRSDPLDSL